MSNPVASILRAATRRPDEPLNIITFPTHERFESNLCKTGHLLWAIRSPQVKNWDATYAHLPPNYILLDPARGDKQLPPGVDFDLVLSQNKAGQFPIALRLSRLLHLPLVSLEHTLPHPDWSPRDLATLKSMRGHLNVFISEFSRKAWGWADDEAEVIKHGVDTLTFCPNGTPTKPHVLSVVNDFKNRDWCCGYQFWEEATKGLPRLHLGSDPNGWSKPAEGLEGLVSAYQGCHVFVDTASASPIPSVVLEAMACGCVVVSRGNAMVPEVIQDGVNGFIRKDPASMRAQLKKVLDHPEDFSHISRAAIKTIRERFSLDRFVKEWDLLLHRAAALTYTGE